MTIEDNNPTKGENPKATVVDGRKDEENGKQDKNMEDPPKDAKQTGKGDEKTHETEANDKHKEVKDQTLPKDTNNKKDNKHDQDKIASR